MAIGFMIDCGRHITEATSVYRAGRVPEARMGRQLKGATLGIIGYGAIGEYMAELGLALGMTVLVADPYKKIAEPGLNQVPFADMLRDRISWFASPLPTSRPRTLMNATAFAQMMPSAFFINLSRGNLVDEAALARALDDKRIAGAALDVGRAQDQMPSLELARRADVIATPHTAGLTPDAAEHQAFDTVNQVTDLIAGPHADRRRQSAGGAPAEPAATRLT